MICDTVGMLRICAASLMLYAGMILYGQLSAYGDRCQGDTPVAFCVDFDAVLLGADARQRLCHKVFKGTLTTGKRCVAQKKSWICQLSTAGQNTLTIHVEPKPRYCEQAMSWCVEHDGLWEADSCA